MARTDRHRLPSVMLSTPRSAARASGRRRLTQTLEIQVPFR